MPSLVIPGTNSRTTNSKYSCSTPALMFQLIRSLYIEVSPRRVWRMAYRGWRIASGSHLLSAISHSLVFIFQHHHMSLFGQVALLHVETVFCLHRSQPHLF